MKKLILVLLALGAMGVLASGCSKPLPTAEELSEKKAEDDAKRAGDSDSD